MNPGFFKIDARPIEAWRSASAQQHHDVLTQLQKIHVMLPGGIIIGNTSVNLHNGRIPWLCRQEGPHIT